VVAVEEMIEQLSVLIRECEEFSSFFHPYWCFGIPSPPVSPEEKAIGEDLQFLSYRLQAAIRRCTTPDDSYRENLNAVPVRDSPDVASAESLLLIAKALRADLQDGWFRSVSELIHADMFSDLLDIARELHKKKYKDAAAVQAGIALELHLHLLAEKHNIETVTEKKRFKSAGDLNVELEKAGVYAQNEKRDVTRMLAIRNDAAHGKFDKYSADKVEKLISEVREFVKRFPA